MGVRCQAVLESVNIRVLFKGDGIVIMGKLTAAFARMQFTSKAEQKLVFPLTKSSRNKSFKNSRVLEYSN